jgi:Family of unknown function (DUF6252)
MTRAATTIASLGLLAAIACGGSDNNGTTGPNGTVTGDGNITASVNGTAWRSSKGADHASRSGTFVGISAANPPYVLILGIGNAAVGSFSLNLATGNGSSAIISNSAGGWGTALSGGSGTITISVLTATRVAGTFSFDAVPASGSGTGTMQVRNGTFDLAF